MNAASFALSRAHRIILALLVFGAAAPAAAACNATVVGGSPEPVVVYDPFAGIARSEDLSIRFVNLGETACTLAISVTSERPGNEREMSRGGASLPYRIETLDGRELPNDANAVVGSVLLPGGRGQQAAFVVRIKVPAGVIAPAGDYEDELTIRAFSVEGGRARLGREIEREVRTRIVSRAQVNIAGSSGSFQGSPFALEQIDFGTLQTGAIRNAFVQVRATAPVSITVSSRNAGALEHATLGASARVPYAASLDGRELTLAAGPTTIARRPSMTLDGESYPLTLRITGAVDQLPAGDYRDILTVNVVPR